jgi:hypothetical protein
VSTRPANRHQASRQHAAGDAHAWDDCLGCGAGKGEQCWSRSRPKKRFGLGEKRQPQPHKKTPCAGRPWTARPLQKKG